MKDIEFKRVLKISGLTAVISTVGAYAILAFLGTGNLLETSYLFFPYVLWITLFAPLSSFLLTRTGLFNSIGKDYDVKELVLGLIIGGIPLTAITANLVLGVTDPLEGLSGILVLIALAPGLLLWQLGVPFIVAFAFGAGLFSVISTVFAVVFERKTEFL